MCVYRRHALHDVRTLTQSHMLTSRVCTYIDMHTYVRGPGGEQKPHAALNVDGQFRGLLTTENQRARMRGEAAHRGERTEGAAYREESRTAEAATAEKSRAAQEGRGPRRRPRAAQEGRALRGLLTEGLLTEEESRAPRRPAAHRGGGRALQRPHTAEEPRTEGAAHRGGEPGTGGGGPRRPSRRDLGLEATHTLTRTLPFCSALSPYLHLMLTVHTDLRKGRGDLLQKLNSIGHRVRGVSSPERQQSGSSCG